MAFVETIQKIYDELVGGSSRGYVEQLNKTYANVVAGKLPIGGVIGVGCGYKMPDRYSLPIDFGGEGWIQYASVFGGTPNDLSCQNFSGAGDWCEYDLWLPKGTYSLEANIFKKSDSGEITIKVDGGYTTVFNCYSGGSLFVTWSIVDSVVIATDKLVTVRIELTDASVWDFWIKHLEFRRTA